MTPPKHSVLRVATKLSASAVVVGGALAAHARSDVPGAQALLKSIGGVLAAAVARPPAPLFPSASSAVAVVDETCQRSLAMHGALEGRGGQRGEQVFAAMVGDAAVRAGIEGEGHVEPAFRAVSM